MNNLFSTQAVNFVDGLRTNVDPRTGQFMVNLPLATINGNASLGPEISLSLNYSPLNNDNYGFGKGFSLGISRFNNLNNTLELSNGEIYKVSPGSDFVRNHKLETFHFSYANGINDAEGYSIFWKDGTAEFLTYQGGNNYVMTRTESPLGRAICVEWFWNGQQVLISKIEDESTLLCQFDYANIVTMTLWPGTVEEYQTEFTLINGDQLDTISRYVSETESLTWYLGYSQPQGWNGLLLTDVVYPTGMKDHVEYSQIDGHMYPSASGLYNRLPVVISHTQTPGVKQPETIRHYTYTQQNFLGYNGNFGDWENNSDYIYTTLTDYIYGSIETIQSDSDKLTIERIYNNYHLQISEEVQRNKCVNRKEMSYYAEPGLFIDAQPAQFQLMRILKETWTDATGAKRTQLTETEFDTAGNPVYEKAPDGTKTLTTWYKASGEKGCPPSPHGFTRFMKSSTVLPRTTKYSAPVLETRYAFSTLSKDTHIVQTEEEEYADDVLLHRKQITYNNISGSSEYGRVLTEESTVFKDTKTYTSSLKIATAVHNGKLTAETTFVGHDSLTFITRQEHSVSSGLLLSEKNAMGVDIVYTYDKAGRLLTETDAPGTLYASTTTWVHSLEKEGPITTISDNLGNKVRILFDGSGRETGREVFDIDGTKKWFRITEAVFNAFSEQIANHSYDWLTSSTEQYNRSMLTKTDDWGSVTLLTDTDGTRTHQVTDPVALTCKEWIDETSSAHALRTGDEITHLDTLSKLPAKTVRTRLNGSILGDTLQEWDGLGRLRMKQDERGNKTTHTYDSYGRLLTLSYPDGTVVSKTYAAHLFDDTVTSISVTGLSADGTVKTWQIGTQEFDSLGRLIRDENGGRITQYEYKNADPEPFVVILPSGKKIHYSRIPELGNVIESVQSDDMLQRFTYDASTGKVILAETEDVDAKTNNRNNWYPSGQLKQEEFIQNGSSRTAGYTYTLGGNAASYTDITGNQTQYKRDTFGRVVEIDDAALTTTFTYDALGRQSEQIVHSKSGKETLITALEYDEFGREVTRTITDSSSNGIVVTQTWLADDLLESRTQKNLRGILLRTETYTYDSRSRMTEYTVSGASVVEDAYGNPLKKQVNSYDALNNLTCVITTLNDNTTDTELHHYDNAADPMQLTSVTHTHPAYPPVISLEYDVDGRMTIDESGRHLEYDIQGRLKSVHGENINGGRYGYDALNRLVTQHVSTNDVRELYYRENELVNETTRNTTLDVCRFIKAGHTNLGAVIPTGLILTGTDHNGSLLWTQETDHSASNHHSWTPWGNAKPTAFLPGFNGERVDPISGAYHLGNGYRAYNPVLRRFNCPDSMSPFGAGGINPYAYCAGDPINNTDPSGHLSRSTWISIGTTIAGVALSVATAGVSIGVAGGVMAAIGSASVASMVSGCMGAVSTVTGIASLATMKSDPKASAILGWVSLASGLASAATGIGDAANKALTNRALAKIARGAADEAGFGRMPANAGVFRRVSGAPNVYASNCPVYGYQIVDAVDDIRKVTRTTKITILAGNHGTKNGKIWGEQLMSIGDKFKDPAIYTSANRISKAKKYVSVVNLPDLNAEQFSRILKDDSTIKILDYCYSRNDAVLRNTFNIKKVDVMTKPPKELRWSEEKLAAWLASNRTAISRA